jgi:hypothetical protein
MGITKRHFLMAAGASTASLLLGRPAVSQIGPHPDPSKFEAGDFIWPAKEGAFIPFLEPGGGGIEAQRQEWETQRQVFLDEARRSGDPEKLAAAERIARTSFEDFYALYYEDASPDAARRFSLSLPEVGHCAILDIDSAGMPQVIEAMPKDNKRYESIYTRFPNGVVTSSYASWIAEHKDYRVWHGRLDGFAQPDRARIAEQARTYLGRDYWFWSFDLADETDFYCSKLLWISAWRTLGVSLDGDNSTARNFWVSPKRLINAKAIVRLHSPGTF